MDSMDKIILYFKNLYYQGIEFFTVVVDIEKLTWIIVILSAFLFLRRITRTKGMNLYGASYIISNMLLLAVCFLEIVYMAVAEDQIWFCMPSKVGWFWTIIDFILFGLICYNQFLYFIDVIDDVVNNNDICCDFRTGLYSWGIGIILIFLASVFYKEVLPYLYGALAIAQIIQVILIFRSYDGDIKNALICSLIYLIGSVGTACVLALYMTILAIVVIGFCILWIVLKFLSETQSQDSPASEGNSYRGSNSHKYCKDCGWYPGHAQHCNIGGKYTNDFTQVGNCVLYKGRLNYN
jgi:preprotein translocase subunit SecG